MSGPQRARVVAAHGRHCLVESEDGTRTLCHPRGKKSQVVVGVNEFVLEEENPIPTMSIDPKVETEQVERLAAFRSRRDGAKVERLRAALVAAAKDGRNLMPSIVEAVDGNVTLGEVVASLKTVFGEHRDAVTL